MKYNHLYIVLCLIISIQILLGCGNEKRESQEPAQGRYEVDILTQSVKTGDFFKAVAYIEQPHFPDKKTNLIVYIEDDESEQLKRDLSNEREIQFVLFGNLRQDEFNQKWFDNVEYDYDRSVIFGKNYDSSGHKIIRGYFLEYFGEYHPENDTVIDGDMVKHYFELELYVKDTIN